MVKGNIIEEMLIAVHQLQSDVKFVMNKVENIENTLTVDVNSLKQNIKVLHEEVETNSKKDEIFMKSLDSFKLEVKHFQKESLKNSEEIRLGLEKSFEENENTKESIDRIKQKVENIEDTLKVDLKSIKESNFNQDKIFIESLENFENTLTVDLNSLQQNIKVLHEEVEKDSNQDKIFIESLDSFKVEVKSFQKESLENAEEIRLSLEKSLKQNENSSDEIDRIKQNGKDCVENCMKPSNVYLEKIESLQEEVKSVQNSLKESVKSFQRGNIENAEKIYHKIESNLKEISKQNSEISKQNLEKYGIQKLYSDNEFSYYKVPVSNGTKLVLGTVSITCAKVGMKAVCSGPEGCSYYSASCVVTPLSSDCSNPMGPLSRIICEGKNPNMCSKLDGVFSHMAKWSGGECGSVDGSHCVVGRDYTSGEMRKGRKRIYYGYCAKRI